MTKNRLKVKVTLFLRDLVDYSALAALTAWISQLSEG